MCLKIFAAAAVETGSSVAQAGVGPEPPASDFPVLEVLGVQAHTTPLEIHFKPL